MKFRFLLFSLLVAFSTISCLDNMQKANANTAEASEGTESETNADSDFKYWTWITADASRTDESYTEEFKKYNLDKGQREGQFKPIRLLSDKDCDFDFNKFCIRKSC